MSPFRSAGESLTPSPVTATTSPCLWNPSTMINFCWGDVLAKTNSEWVWITSSSSSEDIDFSSVPLTTRAQVVLRTSTPIDNRLTALLNIYVANRFKRSLKRGTKPQSVCFGSQLATYYWRNKFLTFSATDFSFAITSNGCGTPGQVSCGKFRMQNFGFLYFYLTGITTIYWYHTT